MKENTVFHFGTSEQQYSCFQKWDKSSRKNKLFLRQTNASESFSTVRKIPTAALVRYRDGFGDLAEAMLWADGLMAAEVKKFRVNFTPKPHPTEVDA